MKINRNVLNVLFIATLTLLVMTLIHNVSAEQTLGIFKQNTCITLKQTCANCTFVNITSLIAPNTEQLLGNVEMTKLDTEYNYSFCATTQLGEYIYTTFGDLDGVPTTQPVTFQINPSGNQSPLGLFIIVIVVLFAVGFIGFFGKYQWISVLGGIGLIALGLYTINNGIDIYRTFITDVFSWITIGLGVIFILVPAIELIQENL